MIRRFVLVCSFATAVLFSISNYAWAFDHALWAGVLNRFVHEGRVRYAELKQDRDQLDQYVESLGRLTRDDYEQMDEDRKIAFWINTYNAITLKVVIDHYPIKRTTLKGLAFPERSIRQIPGVWKVISHPVLGGAHTLDEIEHAVLRKTFNEPRIHMALVCAAKSCPPLRNEPYLGSRLDEQLDDQAKMFFQSSDNFLIDRETRRVYLSSILKWFSEDFSKGETDDIVPGPVRFAAQYIAPEDRAYLLNETYKVDYLKYDWTLNE